MYVSIGSSCNVCEEKDPRRATIVRYRPDGSGEQIHARGLRNSVGFDWRPETGELFATDNGRDLLGDDFPPCELNRISEGGFYGWPYVNGDRVRDPDLGAGRDAELAATSRRYTASAPTPRRWASPSCAIPRTVTIAARHWSRCTARGTARARTATRSCRCTGTPTARSASATS